jgi:hypothetical protein
VPLIDDGNGSADSKAARVSIGDYIGSYIHDFYNANRRHKHIGQISSVEFEQQHRQAMGLAA